MSRREEIKKKEALQLKFQQAIRQNNSKVGAWLTPGTEKVAKPVEFLNLPIIELGKTLNSISNETESFQTFLENDKGTTKKLQSNAMSSLMNRIRNDYRNKVNKQPSKQTRQRNTKSPVNSKDKCTKSRIKENESESSDDDSNHTTHVKKPKLLF